MFWYTSHLWMCLLFRDAKPSRQANGPWAGSVIPHNGHTIAEARRGLMGEKSPFQSKRPFFCVLNTQRHIKLGASLQPVLGSWGQRSLAPLDVMNERVIRHLSITPYWDRRELAYVRC
jgi:hypothetical protein